MQQFLSFLKSKLFPSFIALSVISCGGKSDDKKPGAGPAGGKGGKQGQPTVVDVMIAEPTSMTNVIEANGTVVANEYLDIHPEVSGRLTYLNISEGSHIAAGTVIARINDADLRAQVAKTRVQLDLAKKTEARYKQLIDIGGMNQSDYDAVVNQINAYNADIAYTQTLIDKTVIRAPFSGVAGLRQVSPGAYVTPASTLVTLQQISKVKIDFTVPESYGNLIKKGATVDVELGDTSNRKTQATIIATEPGANTDTRNIKVRAVLKEGTANPGAFVKVSMDAGTGKTAIKVPTNSIIPEDKNNQLVLVKDGKASFVNVQTGVREANAVEITSGIKPGDSIVVRGVLFARPKSPLKVRSVKTLDEFLKIAEQ